MKKTFVKYWYLWIGGFLVFVMWLGQFEPKKTHTNFIIEEKNKSMMYYKCKSEINRHPFHFYDDSLTFYCDCVASKCQTDSSLKNIEKSMNECFRESMINKEFKK